MGQYSEAIKWYEKALAINPEHVISLNNKGVCLLFNIIYNVLYFIWDKINKQLNVMTKLWQLILNLQILYMGKVFVYRKEIIDFIQYLILGNINRQLNCMTKP